jgi:hypothetical protein
MGTRKVKAKARVKDRTAYDMQRYYRSLDLAELWTDFYVSIAPSGRPKYASAKHFARLTATNPQQREFLTWLFGPGNPEQNKEFSFAQPLDFEKKRADDGWFNEANLKAHSKDIRQQINALEALRTAGNGITINSLARMEGLARKLDEDFGGRFFVEGLTSKENFARARLYLAMHDKLLKMIGFAQDIYAKSHGINFQDMSGFERLLAAQALALAGQQQTKSTRAEKMLDNLVQMVLEKGVKHKLPLPEDVDKVITMDAAVPRKKTAAVTM